MVIISLHSFVILACLCAPFDKFAFALNGLPGLYPNFYSKGDLLSIQVNPVQTSAGQEGIADARDATDSLLFCRSTRPPEASDDDQVQVSSRSISSAFRLYFERSVQVEELCTVPFTARQAFKMNSMIREGNLKYSWLIDDNLPVAYNNGGTGTGDLEIAFPLGKVEEGGRTLFYTHFDLKISIQPLDGEGEEGGKFVIVGADVDPSLRADLLDEINGGICKFTYSVSWIKNGTSAASWDQRWNRLNHKAPKSTLILQQGKQIKLTIISLLISLIAAGLLYKAVRIDIVSYHNNNDFSMARMGRLEMVEEEPVWTFVRGDVYRTPREFLLLTLLVGNGLHYFAVIELVTVVGMIGVFSPFNWGTLVDVTLAFYVIFALPAGYLSSRLYKGFGGHNWKLHALLNGTLIPLIVFLLFSVINLIAIGSNDNRSGVPPFKNFLGLLALWLGLSTPLTLAGSWLGNVSTSRKQFLTSVPFKVNPIPRAIPYSNIPAYLRYQYVWPSLVLVVLPMLLAGSLQVLLIPLMSSRVMVVGSESWPFIMLVSLESGSFVTFQLLLLCTLVIGCISTLWLVYSSLDHEDYHWWWRSFIMSALSSVPLFIMLMLMVRLARPVEALFTLSTGLIGFGWALLLSGCFGIVFGAFNFSVSLYFIRHCLYESLSSSSSSTTNRYI